MKLKHHSLPEHQQLALQLDFSPAGAATPSIDHAAPQHSPGTGLQQPQQVQAPPAGAPKRRIQLGTQQLEYVLLRSKRRSIGFLIDDHGLRVTAPKWVTIAEIENAVRDKQRWIFSKLSERRERTERRLEPQLRWRDGATLPYLGDNIVLRIIITGNAGIAYDAVTRALTVCLPADAGEQQLKDIVQHWLQTEARQLFASRLALYAAKLGVVYRAFTLSLATTQWGSCTVDGKIRLNWRLIHFALPLIDYVVAHELSHLREMNHSVRFWDTVQSIFPDFKQARKTLREQAQETLPIF